MWVIKAKGESYYVEHVDCSVPWSTKETPDNNHTKGAIKIKNCLLTIDDNNCAKIDVLTEEDRVKYTKSQTVRIITQYGSKLRAALASMTHGAIKMAGGGCGTTWYITDIPSMKHFLLLQLQIPDVRVLMANEDYYKQYDRTDSDDNWLDEDDDFEWSDLYEE
jgi:hypothetical protein